MGCRAPPAQYRCNPTDAARMPAMVSDRPNDDGHSEYDPLDPAGDCFHPPSISTLVHCLHCHEEYDSYRMEWRVKRVADGKLHGFWCCPIDGCDGKGFGFDIHPVDADYVDPDGRDMGQWSEDPPPDPDTDLDKPPAQPTPVRCEHCGREYSSADMVWWVDEDAEPEEYVESGWRCPTPGCDGMGFGRDVRPTDPDYVDADGRRLLRPGERLPPLPEGDEDIPF